MIKIMVFVTTPVEITLVLVILDILEVVSAALVSTILCRRFCFSSLAFCRHQ